MEDGLSFNMVLSGATLVSVLGLIFKVWRSSRAQKIEQPLNIQPTMCDRQIKSNYDEHTNIFCRLSVSEQRLSAVESSVTHIDHRLESMDLKLDKLLIQETRNDARHHNH